MMPEREMLPDCSPEHDQHDTSNTNRNNETQNNPSPAHNTWGKTWQKVENWLKEDEELQFRDLKNGSAGAWKKDSEEWYAAPLDMAISKLSRPTKNLMRHNSEMRDRLCVFEPNSEERRAVSVGRRNASSQVRTRSPSYTLQPSHSAPDLSQLPVRQDVAPIHTGLANDVHGKSILDGEVASEKHQKRENELVEKPLSPAVSNIEGESGFEIEDEMESRWILNLSMHFKDRSDREKFFVTYAEAPNRWRRITVSIDYRNPGEDSLEADLKNLRYQRDKSARIYDAIRDSLIDIQFYSTVTNLKLKTMDGQLHVHCSEDHNEIIPYPMASMLQYLPFPFYREADVLFDSHISGFVYKVNIDGDIMVKKEIPGPESVDEFLYEVTALSSLRISNHVINFEGLVIDDRGTNIKGLLISFASKGALLDLIYDARHSDSLPWSRREKWARQIVSGLCDIHEAGFVQGDFTLSNIVVDESDNVWLIDVNRRGCPVGWEPPELEALIRAGQHISMFIGVKTDLFQLGMVLWALASCIDEPEREQRPLSSIKRPDVPDYFRRLVERCLQTDPRQRMSARDLLALFPPMVTGVDIVDAQGMKLPLVIEMAHNQSSTEAGATLDIRPGRLLSGPSAPSQISEVSSINTNELNTIASSDYMFEPSELRRQALGDSSSVTQSDSERPRTRDEADLEPFAKTKSLADSLPQGSGTPTRLTENPCSASDCIPWE